MSICKLILSIYKSGLEFLSSVHNLGVRIKNCNFPEIVLLGYSERELFVQLLHTQYGVKFTACQTIFSVHELPHLTMIMSHFSFST